MTKLEKVIVGLAAGALATIGIIMFNSAQAAEERTATLNWSNPTTYTDTSPLNSADIGGYYIYWEDGAEPTVSSSRIDFPAPGGSINYIASFLLDPRPQPYVFHFKVSIYLTDGRESALSSDTGIKDFGVVKSTALPNAPMGLSVVK